MIKSVHVPSARAGAKGDAACVPCLRCSVCHAWGPNSLASLGQPTRWDRDRGSPVSTTWTPRLADSPPGDTAPSLPWARREVPAFCDNFIQLLSSWVPGTKIQQKQTVPRENAALGGHSPLRTQRLPLPSSLRHARFRGSVPGPERGRLHGQGFGKGLWQPGCKLSCLLCLRGWQPVEWRGHRPLPAPPSCSRVCAGAH